ncbi:MAG: lactonase family protein [Parabacteroides sp.]|nr:lactonase family protein [Parabacteroides sp.]
MSKITTSLLGLMSFFLMSCMKQQVNEAYLLVGSYAEKSEKGISLYRFDMETGSTELVNEFSGIAEPSYQTFAKEGEYVYSVSETEGEDAKVCAYVFDKKEGKLSFLNEQITKGGAPCHIWVDSKQRLAVTANYLGGNISAFPIASDGTLEEAEVFSFEGGTPGSSRQEAPHLHCIYVSPDERFLFANDLGTDRIYKFELRETEGRLSLQAGSPAFISLPIGEGPRHAEFHPNGKWLYLLSELSGKVAVFDYKEGDLTPIQFIEADSLHAAGSADIHVSPDGRFVYASNRLEGDGIAIFEINQEDGRLKKIGYQPTGVHPRNFIITANGKFLLCACRDSHVVQIFTIDSTTGLLQDTGQTIQRSKPVCLKFTDL